MNALVRKEIRLILPAWAAALGLAIVPIWLFSTSALADWSQGAPACLALFALGVIFLGVAPFGQECSLGTFSVQLAQPVPRRQIWLTKIGVLGVALTATWIALLLSCLIRSQGLASRSVLGDLLIIGGLTGLSAFAGGLWTTLLLRQVAAAFWITLLVPPAILVATSRVWEKRPEDVALALVSAVLLLYALAGVWLAHRLFFAAQDTPWLTGAISLPDWFSLGTRTRSSVPRPKRRPLRALLEKEFQSHQVSLLLAGGMLLLHLAVIVLRKMEYDPSYPKNVFQALLEFWWVLWFGLPFLVGSAAVAEERKLGTLECQLCLPASRASQFTVKFVVALLLGVLLGGLMPWVAEIIGGLKVVPGSFSNLRETRLGQSFALTCLVSAGATIISFYASTLTRNFLQAMGVAVVVGLALGAFGIWAFNEAFGRFDSHRLWVGPLVIYLGLPTLMAVWWWLTFNNFRRLYVGLNLWLRNLFVLFVSLAFIVGITTLLYNRAWELLMTLEPKHGPPQLSGSVRPRICVVGANTFVHLPDGRPAGGGRMFALLPDGRLWVMKNYRFQLTGKYVSFPNRSEEVYMAVPVDGTFLGASNWVNLASTYNEVVGLQSDGSLWKIFSENRTNLLANLSAVPKPERIGTDSDWKTVAGGTKHFLALKEDGTLWGWGNNHNGQVGAGPEHFTNPVHIGNDSDWAAVFASQITSIAVKRDGSVWKWGHLSSSPLGYGKSWEQGTHREPVRWNLDGRDWLTFEGSGFSDLVVRRDGTLWVMGNITPDLLGNHLFGNDYRTRFTAKPLRVGTDSDWSDIASEFGLLALLKRNGRIFQHHLFHPYLAFWGAVWKPSKYSDWIAIATHGWDSVIALAADGTLCSWGDPGQQAFTELHRKDRTVVGRPVLGPSRKPLWTANIFAKSDPGEVTRPGRP